MTASEGEKPLVWLQSEVRTPPFSKEGRLKAGMLLRRLQRGGKLSMPFSRPMPSIGPRCHELRLKDEATNTSWRVFYRVDPDAIVIAGVERKTSRTTPTRVIDKVRKRLKRYDADVV